MSNERTGEGMSVTRTDEIRMLDRAQALLNTSLETDDPEEKNYAIRSALQYLVFLHVSKQAEQAESEEPLRQDNTHRE